MPADRVFRRPSSLTHTGARKIRAQKGTVVPVLRLALVAFVLGLLVVAVIFTKPRFNFPRVKTITCMLEDTTVCPQSVTDQLQQLLEKPLLFTALHADASQVVEPLGFSVVGYRRILPNQLELTLRTIDILLYLEYQDGITAITTTGVKLPTTVAAVDSSYLQLHSLDPVTNETLEKTGRLPHWLLETMKQLQLFFTDTGFVPDSMTLDSPFQLTLVLTHQARPILINPQESALNLHRLSSILKSDQFTAVASTSATLDVRFRLPVLR